MPRQGSSRRQLNLPTEKKRAGSKNSSSRTRANFLAAAGVFKVWQSVFVNCRLKTSEDELQQLQVPSSEQESYKLLRSDFEELLRLLKNILKTNYDDLHEKGVQEDLEGSFHLYPRIEQLHQELRGSLLSAAPKVFTKATLAEIRSQLNEVTGRHLPNFISPDVFNVLMIKWFRPYKALIQAASDNAIECVEEVVENCARLVVRKELFDFVRDAMHESLASQFSKMEEDTNKILEKEGDVVHTQNEYYTVTLRKLQKALAKGTEMLPQEEDSDEDVSTEAQNTSLETPHASLQQVAGGMISAREWLSTKLRLNTNESQRLQARNQSHDPKDMHALEMQLSAFCYDKVHRKRICDDLMKNVRHYLWNFLEEDPGGRIRCSLDSIPHSKIHDRLTNQSVHEKQRRKELTAQLQQYRELLTHIDGSGGAVAAASESHDWGGQMEGSEAPSL